MLSEHVAELERFYGLLPFPPRDPFMLFVWEVLSQHSTPPRREAALAAMKKARILTPDAVARAPRKVLEAAMSAAGPYGEQRLQALKAGADAFRRMPRLPAAIRGRLRTARRALKPLRPLGGAGAHRMLLFAADRAVLPVDARVQRVAVRLGYSAAGPGGRTSARAVRRALTAELPRGDIDAYRRAFVYLSHHGAVTCTEADPHCAICPLLARCPEGMQRAENVKSEV